MNNLDFTDKNQNEVLEELAIAAEWLAAQYAAGLATLSASTLLELVQSTDPQKRFFLDAATQHLPVLITCTRVIKSASLPTPSPEPPEF